MSRRPTNPEWNQLQGFFPGLVHGDVWITGEPTPVYNCIAYSLGYLDRWIDPPQPTAEFEKLYIDHGYSVAATGSGSATVDGWQKGAEMTHGSRTSTSEAPPLWESKLGQYFRITHGRNQLAGNLYGAVVTSFAET